MTVNLNSYFQQWRDANATARQEERRLFHAALDSVSGGVAPSDSEWIACGELRLEADNLFYLAMKPQRVSSARTPSSLLAPLPRREQSALA